MVCNLVSKAEPPASATPPLGDTVHSSDLRLGDANCQLDGFDMTGGWGLLCIHDGVGLFSMPPSS